MGASGTGSYQVTSPAGDVQEMGTRDRSTNHYKDSTVGLDLGQTRSRVTHPNIFSVWIGRWSGTNASCAGC
jgi:hypothetical protein